MIEIRTCPTCGSKRIKKVRKNWKGDFHGKAYVVPDLEYHECPACGEKVYSPDAMRKIEAHSPAYVKAHAGK